MWVGNSGRAVHKGTHEASLDTCVKGWRLIRQALTPRCLINPTITSKDAYWFLFWHSFCCISLGGEHTRHTT